MITDKQEKRLEDYKAMLLADLAAQMPDEAYSAFCKIKGYLQALVDLEQITEAEMQKLAKKYAF